MDEELTSQRDVFGMKLAGAVPRLISYLIDGVILGVAFQILFLVTGASGNSTEFSLVYFLAGVAGIGYYIYFFGNGQTLGMKAMKIKLIGTDGTYPVGYGKGILRYLGMVVSTMILLLGYIWILIDKKNQGWHDKIAGTYVVEE